jgi:3-methyladenine DNA glycosylase AlkD
MPTPGANPASRPSFDLNWLVSQFVALRDRKRALEKQHEAELKPFTKLLDEIGGKLLQHLQEIKADSVSTPGGTAYQITKPSAVIRDGAAFRSFITTTENFDMVDWRANANAVFEYIAEHDGEPPPGIHASTFVRIGVRQPNEKE